VCILAFIRCFCVWIGSKL